MSMHEQEPGGARTPPTNARSKQDRGKRHAAARREEQRQRPGRRGNRKRRQEARAEFPLVQDDQAGGLADALADPTDREEQDRRRNGNENVVEAGEKPELLFVGDSHRTLAFDMRAERIRRLRR